jgi:hypothetical protein
VATINARTLQFQSSGSPTISATALPLLDSLPDSINTFFGKVDMKPFHLVFGKHWFGFDRITNTRDWQKHVRQAYVLHPAS